MIGSTGMNSYLNASMLMRSMYPMNGMGVAPVGANPMAGPTGILSASSAEAAKFAKAQVGALVGLSSNMRQLKTDAAALDSSSSSSVWNKRSVTSSTPPSVSGMAKDGAKKDTYTVDVTQIAVAQQSTGSALASTTATTLASGTQSFSISVGGGPAKNISFSVAAGDTNQTVLNNMAQSINAAKGGVTASVVTKGGNSQLVITGNNTGVANSFSLTDATGSSAVVNTGANTVSTASADVKYTVNGTAYTSGKNTVTLAADAKVSLTLAAPVTGAKVTIGNNNDAIASAVNKFASSYNSVMSYLAQNEQYINPQLANTLKHAVSTHAADLKAAGITTNAAGILTVDQTALQKSIISNPTSLKHALGDYAGAAAKSGLTADKVISSPLTSFARPMPFNPSSYYPLFNNQRSAYQQWFVGAIFNRLA